MSYGSSADIGVVVGQIGILGDSLDREERKRLHGDVVRYPEPDQKPDPHAQWDEVHAHWQVWDKAAGQWVVVPHDADDQ
jgi:hypothetical protein